MKYLVVFVLVVLLARIDWLLREYDKLSERFKSPPPEVQATDANSRSEVISMTEDKNLKQTPREAFLALLSVFRDNPSKEARERAMDYFKAHPTVLGQKLDPDLEAIIFRWRDLLIQNNPELANFLIDLMNILQGENLVMLKRFFSLWMEVDMQNFLSAYSRTRDTNCLIAAVIGDNIPEDEKANIYFARRDVLKSLTITETLSEDQRALANNCLTVLNIEISKLPPPPVEPVPETSSDEESP